MVQVAVPSLATSTDAPSDASCATAGADSTDDSTCGSSPAAMASVIFSRSRAGRPLLRVFMSVTMALIRMPSLTVLAIRFPFWSSRSRCGDPQWCRAITCHSTLKTGEPEEPGSVSAT